MTPYEQFKVAKRVLDAKVEAKQQQVMMVSKPIAVTSPALATVEALQAQVLRQHQLDAIEQIGQGLQSLVPMLATFNQQLALHGIKATNMTLAEIAAGRLYHDIAEAVAISQWASHKLEAGAALPDHITAASGRIQQDKQAA